MRELAWEQTISEAASAAQRRAKALAGDVELEVEGVSFDSLIPFLLDDKWSPCRDWAAQVLTLAREVAARENSGRDSANLRAVLEKLEQDRLLPVLRWDVARSEAGMEALDIRRRYILWTNRVEYRFEVVRFFALPAGVNEATMEALRALSAFLLFDDDLRDREEDSDSGKLTPVVECQSATELQELVSLMMPLAKRSSLATEVHEGVRRFAAMLVGFYDECFNLEGSKDDGRSGG